VWLLFVGSKTTAGVSRRTSALNRTLAFFSLALRGRSTLIINWEGMHGSVLVRFLVTGGSGFLGRNLLSRLRQEGHHAVGFNRTVIPGSISGDLRHLDAITAAVTEVRPDVVINLASQTATGAQASLDDYAVNAQGVDNLCQAVAASPDVRRVLWVSSQLVCRPGRQPLRDDDYDPVGLYGTSKMIGEQTIRGCDGGGKEWMILRPTTVWGPGMGPHYQRLLRAIRRGLYFHVGYKPLYKSYAYIDNIVDQFMKLSRVNVANFHGRTLYMADSDPIELHAWCDGFARIFNRKIPTLPKPVARPIALLGDMAGAMGFGFVPFNSERLHNILTQYVFDVRPIEALCGRSGVSIPEGIQRTADWFIANEAGNLRRTQAAYRT
jgi:nucleoside-diphosphate-sugar epimerase